MSFSPKPSLPAMNGVFFASSAFLFCRKTAPGAGRAVLSPPALGCPGWGRPDPHPPTGALEYEDGSMGSIPAGAARLGFPIGGGLERTFAVTGSGSLVLATGTTLGCGVGPIPARATACATTFSGPRDMTTALALCSGTTCCAPGLFIGTRVVAASPSTGLFRILLQCRQNPCALTSPLPKPPHPLHRFIFAIAAASIGFSQLVEDVNGLQ